MDELLYEPEKLSNTLIDNTDKLKMAAYLRRCIKEKDINTIQIATGYWDVPGMALVVDKLATFLEREGTQLQILIGQEPYVYASQVKEPTYRKNFPDDYIKKDLEELELKEEYKGVVDLLLTHCGKKMQVRKYTKDFEKPKIMYPNMTKYLPFAYDNR